MSYYVKDYMDKTFSTIDVDEPVREAAQIIASGPHGFVIVTEKGSPKGWVSSVDIVKKVVSPGLNPDSVKVREVMDSPLLSIDPDEDLLKASDVMHKNGVRRIAVVKSGILYGIITASDIAQGCGLYVDKAVKDVLRWSFPMR